jgi:cellulase/cellobiase CelA1
MRRRLVTLGAAALLIGAGLAVARAPIAASAAPVCAVDFTVDQWSTAFTADVQVTNGGAPVTSWTLSWTFAGDQRVTNGWNATISQTGATVTAASAAWNGSLVTGASARFGFQATYSVSNPVPAAFTFNGCPAVRRRPPRP